MVMKAAQALVLVGAVLPVIGGPLPGSSGFISLDIRRATIPASIKRSRAQVRGIPQTDLTDLTNAYIADVAIGSPPQPIQLIIDSGSSWLWVNPVCEYAANTQICLSSPQYDPSKSIPAPERVSALDGYQDYAGGFWAQTQGYSDNFWLDNTNKVAKQAFGIAMDSDGAFLGFLGLGPDLVTGFDSTAANYSVVNTLATQGVISSRTYALGLEKSLVFNADSPKSLIFGGVDKNKFRGDFFKLPVQLPGKGGGDEYWRFWVQLSGVSHTLANGTHRPSFNFTGRAATYIVDTGTTGIYLPRDFVSSVMSDLKLQWSPGSFASIDCRRAAELGNFTFSFGDRTIVIPYSTLVLENQPGSCLFLITSVESNAIDLHILGLGFLRGAYTVFDWDNRAVYIAERADCGTDTDATAIAAGPTAVLNIKGNCP